MSKIITYYCDRCKSKCKYLYEIGFDKREDISAGWYPHYEKNYEVCKDCLMTIQLFIIGKEDD